MPVTGYFVAVHCDRCGLQWQHTCEREPADQALLRDGTTCTKCGHDWMRVDRVLRVRYDFKDVDDLALAHPTEDRPLTTEDRKVAAETILRWCGERGAELDAILAGLAPTKEVARLHVVGDRTARRLAADAAWLRNRGFLNQQSLSANKISLKHAIRVAGRQAPAAG